ncbi:MAG: type II toxin-antitoxin system mRNA interferase toxin, RelE/StbE family [Vicingaceae bacterium]
MYEIVFTSKSKKDLKRLKKRNDSDFKKVKSLINLLQDLGAKGVPPSMKPHPLKGNYAGTLECHVKPDLLVI